MLHCPEQSGKGTFGLQQQGLLNEAHLACSRCMGLQPCSPLLSKLKNLFCGRKVFQVCMAAGSLQHRTVQALQGSVRSQVARQSQPVIAQEAPKPAATGTGRPLQIGWTALQGG